MAYFPFFVDLTGRTGLVIGGGAVALRKTRKLLPYQPRLTVVSPSFLPAFSALDGVELLHSEFTLQNLEGAEFVIAATDDPTCNHAVATQCQKRGIPVNSVTDKGDCTFLFPALIQRGDLSIGISTGGASPAVAAYLRREMEGLLPERLEEVLASLEPLREELKTREPDSAARGRQLTALVAAAMAAGRPLDRQEIEAMIAQSGGKA